MDWIDLAQGRNRWYGSCEHGNELTGCIKNWAILEWLGDWRILKKAQLHGDRFTVQNIVSEFKNEKVVVIWKCLRGTIKSL
jgi:hypothetical protein